jgi:hypothetical protein
VTGERRGPHNEELYALYYSPNIIQVIKRRRLRWVRLMARTGKRRGEYRFLMGRPEVRRPLARPRYRWEDHSKMDLQDMRRGGMEWIDVA